jgi:cell division transport system ATP-binding protein
MVAIFALKPPTYRRFAGAMARLRPALQSGVLDGGGAVVSFSGATVVRPSAGRKRGPNLVRFENVGMRYGTGSEVLRDISFKLEPGSFHFLTGPSGAGKSSLLKLLYLAHKPSRGLVTLFDQEIATAPREALPALRRRIGVVFQDFRLLDHLSAFENVALPLRIAGVSDTLIRDHVGQLLNWVGLTDDHDLGPAAFSGGQKQRLAIARAVIARPQLLLADEPTGNLDPDLSLRSLHLFEELNKLGTTVLIATHNRDFVARFKHPALHLHEGCLVDGSEPHLKSG